MIRRAVRIFCEEEHGFGDVAFPELASDVRWVEGPTVAELRRLAKTAGWKRIQGADYCPECAELIEGRR